VSGSLPQYYAVSIIVHDSSDEPLRGRVAFALTCLELLLELADSFLYDLYLDVTIAYAYECFGWLNI
jgi:hypothetical protein